MLGASDLSYVFLCVFGYLSFRALSVMFEHAGRGKKTCKVKNDYEDDLDTDRDIHFLKQSDLQPASSWWPTSQPDDSLALQEPRQGILIENSHDTDRDIDFLKLSDLQPDDSLALHEMRKEILLEKQCELERELEQALEDDIDYQISLHPAFAPGPEL